MKVLVDREGRGTSHLIPRPRRMYSKASDKLFNVFYPSVLKNVFNFIFNFRLCVCTPDCVYICARECRRPRPRHCGGLQMAMSCLYGCWEPNSGPLQEQYELSSPKPSLQPLVLDIFFFLVGLYISQWYLLKTSLWSVSGI